MKLLGILFLIISCSTTRLGNGTPKWIQGEVPDEYKINFLTAIGTGSDIGTAENSAKQSLAEIFSSKIKTVSSSNKSYTFSDGIESDSTNYASNVNITTDIELKNIKIVKYYYDKQMLTHYALAALDTRIAKRDYSNELLDLNQKIKSLVKSFEIKPKIKHATEIKTLTAKFEQLNVEFSVVNNGKRMMIPITRDQWLKIEKAVEEISNKNFLYVEFLGPYEDFKNLTISCLSGKGLKIISNKNSRIETPINLIIKLEEENVPLNVKGWVSYSYKATATIKKKNNLEDNVALEKNSRHKTKIGCYHKIKTQLSKDFCNKIFNFISN